MSAGPQESLSEQQDGSVPFTLANLVRGFAAERPDAPAITCDDVRLSFADLHRRSSQLANVLAAEGVGRGDRVAILARNSPAFYELVFACSKLGAALVGLNWRLAAPEIAFIIDDAALALLVAEEEFTGLVPAPEGTQGPPTILLGEDYESRIDAASSSDPMTDSRPEDVVLLLYSSGTTGRPKGAMLTNANLSFTLDMGRVCYRMGPDSVNLVTSPLFHIGGIGYGLSTMGQGGHTVIMRAARTDDIVAAIQRERLTHAFWVPAVIQSVIDAPESAHADLSSLEIVAYGGAPITEALLLRAIEKLECGFVGVYGMTETAGTVLSLPPEDHDPAGPRAYLLRSVGKPPPWCTVAVCDPEGGTEVGVGDVGEIWVQSGMNMAGYWNRPQETAETITPAGWLRTGDAGYRDGEGYFYLHDRIKDLIISGGENVYPAEVENVLAAHPAVSEVAVIGVPHERWGETVKAIVVRRPGVDVSAADIIEFARTRIARYKCPTSVDFAETLPRNAGGKVLKKLLREPYWSSHEGKGE